VGAATLSQRLFNRRLEGARRAVADDAMLRLRSRWQCLSKRNDCSLDLLPTMVLACCVLHNLCEARGDALRPEWREEVVHAETRQPATAAAHQQGATEEELGEGEEARRLFCDYFQQQEGL